MAPDGRMMSVEDILKRQHDLEIQRQQLEIQLQPQQIFDDSGASLVQSPLKQSTDSENLQVVATSNNTLDGSSTALHMQDDEVKLEH